MSNTPIFPGFDPDWESVPDYVLGTTWDLWEGRGLAVIGDHMASDVIVRDASAVRQGPTPLRHQAMSVLAAQPDLALLGEDVIWCATDRAKDVPAGFYASHRMTATATHRGDGIFGPPTGAPLRYRIMTDSWCAENHVRDRWSIHDTGAIIRQIGSTPKDWIAGQLDTTGLPSPLVPDTDIEGPYFDRGNKAAPADELTEILTAFMGADFSVVGDRYDRACEVARPGGVSDIGHRPAEDFWLSLRAAFPSAAFRVEHAVGMTEPGQPPRAALRWSLYGKHDGPGMFGAPTGCFVYVLGITHAEFGPRGLRREWTLIDECAIWAQILGTPG